MFNEEEITPELDLVGVEIDFVVEVGIKELHNLVPTFSNVFPFSRVWKI